MFYSRAVRPSAAGDGGDVGGLTILLATLLGAATLIAGKRVETRVRGYWLKKRGKLLLTEYKGLHYDRSEEHNGDHFIQVVSQWRDPVTDELYTFLSEPFGRDPSQRIRSTSISVFVDPRNFENYYMELSSSEGGGFTEESSRQTTRDLRSRLMESLDALVLGVVLFVVSFPVLLFNESYVVRMERSLQEGSKAVVDVPSDRVDPANESMLVHVTGRATTDESIADPTFGVSAHAIKLRRKVEMYQWQEASSKAPDATGSPTETTYSYSPVWSEQPIDSGGFNEPQGHRNPPMPFSSVEYVAADVKLGAFKLNPHIVAQLRGGDPVDVSPARLPDLVHARASRLESGFEIGDPASPRIGDLRVTFEQLRSPQVSIVARQTRDTFEAYRAASGGSVELVVMGIASVDTIFAGARSANSFGPRAWLLRCLGFVLMSAGLALVPSSFSTLGEVAPVVCSLMRFGRAIGCGLVALCLSLVTVAAAWIRFRPSVGIWLLASAAILASFGYCATRFGMKPRSASMSA